MLSRRLLTAAVGSGSGIVIPDPPPTSPPIPFVITNPPEGGLTAWSVSQAVYAPSVDKTFVGYVQGSLGTERILEYDHNAQTGTIRSIHGSFEKDEHSPPGIMFLPDGRLLVAYTKHNAIPFYRRITTNAYDALTWGSVLSLDASLGGTRYTYPKLHHLTDVTGDPVHLYYRDEPTAGDDSRWCRSISTNEGSTWGTQTIIFRQAGERSYLTTWADGRYVHFGASNGLTGSAGKMGHFYFDGVNNTFHKSDGTAMGSPPFNFSHITEVAGGGLMLPLHLHIDGTGKPYMAATSQTSGTGEWRYWACRWTGSAWIASNVASGGQGHPYSSPTSTSSFGCTFDDGNLNHFYALKEEGGSGSAKSELVRYTTADGWQTWDAGTAITSGSNVLQTRPMPVRGGRDDGLVLVWTYGTMSHYKTWSFGIKGLRV